ncbi:MAG TPA: hypothetical protein VGM67_13890 [Gemmatimonadaceae bacterium]|jgi:hypothetical protein
MIKLTHGLAMMIMLGTTLPALAQSDTVPRYRMRLLGVYDDASGDPVEGVKISDVLGGASTITGKTGAISLFFLPEGTSVVRLQKLGYEVQTLTVTIAPDQTSPLTMLMHRVVELPTVVTTDVATAKIAATMRGFTDREHNRKTGYFVDDSILRKSEDSRLADVLRNRTPGVNITTVAGSMYLTTSSRCMDGTKAGPPQVYLDGIALSPDPISTGLGVMQPGPKVPFDLTRFQVSDLAGIEWYPDASLIPAELARPTDRCGALFLWTRH